MAGGGERHVREVAAEEVDKFAEGLRVLAVDDDPTCLKVLEFLLRKCKYQPTVVTDARTALQMLREGGEDQFDLVITDVHMPGMDGYKLLEQIGLEMDLPVIMMSVDGDKTSVYKGIAHGACDYLVKPINIKELRNIWQHVVRKNLGAMNQNSSDSDDADQNMVQLVIAKGDAKDKKFSKKKKSDGDDSDDKTDNTGIRVRTTQKRPRLTWTVELHRRFLEVINRLGVDKAYPKTILQMMNVDYLTRASVASHLQKYRIFLKRVGDYPTKSNVLGEPYERRNSCSCMNLNHQGSNNLSATPSVLGPHGVYIQSSNYATGTVDHGGIMARNDDPWMSDARRRHVCGPLINSFAKISDHKMLDAFSSNHSDKEYTNSLREKILEASNVVPSSHSTGKSFANMTNNGMLEPINQFLVQPSELLCKHSAVGTHHHAQFPCHVGNSSNLTQNVAPSNFPGPMAGTPLLNIPEISQLPSFVASPGQMPMFQDEQPNQMEGMINNTIPLAGFNEQTDPFNMASNRTLVEMTSDNFAAMSQMVNGGSTSSPLPNLQMGSSVALPTQMFNVESIRSALTDLQDNSVMPTKVLNGGDASDILPMQEDLADRQAPDDQPTYSNSFFPKDIFLSMANQDFNDDVFFGGEC